MNSYERVMNTLEGKLTDHPAVNPILMAYAASFIGRTYRDYYLDHNVLVESYLRCLEKFSFDMVMVISDPFRETEGFGATFEYPQDAIPAMKKTPLSNLDEIQTLKVPDPEQHPRMADRLRAVEGLKREVGTSVPVVGWVEAPFAEACDLRGVQNLMIDALDHPEKVHTLLEVTLQAAVRFAQSQVEAGADIIGIGDAAASMTSPSMFEELVLPYERKLIQSIHQMGSKVKLHICGNTTALLPYLARTGADIVDLDWMVDLAEARRVLGPSITICGNVDPVSIMLQGNREDVFKKSLECYHKTGMPFILSAGCEIPPGTPVSNLKTLCDSVREMSSTP